MLFRGLIGLIVIVALVVVIIFWQAGALIKSGTETYGPGILKTDVSLEDAHLSPLSGEAYLKGLVIGQPEGFGEGEMISFKQFVLKLRPKTLITDHIIIDELLIDAPHINARIQDGQSNFQAFSDAIFGASKSPDANQSNTLKKTVTIHNMHIINPSLQVKSDKTIKIDQTVTLESFTLTDLGTDKKGLSFGEVTRHVMAVLEPQVAKAMINMGLKDQVKGLAEKQLDKLTSKTDGELGSGLKSVLGSILGKKKKEETDSKNDNDGTNNN